MQNNPADFSKLAYAHSKPEFKAELKREPEDFVVEEVSNTELSGAGEHLWCWVEKRQQNTEWVAGQLAKWAQTSQKNIGFAGQKDRHAVTRQWFSLHLPGKPDPDLTELSAEGVRVLKSVRHHRKLQRGDLLGNQFLITLRSVTSTQMPESTSEFESQLESRLQCIKKHGFPNYFGSQRFGWQGNNLLEAEKLFAMPVSSLKQKRQKRQRNQSQRNKQGLYLSAVRSWMFNEVLSLRIQENSWNQCINGDFTLLHGQPQNVGMDELQQKNKVPASFPVGTLFGDAALCSTGHASVLEEQVQSKYPLWMEGIKSRRIQPSYRVFGVIPDDFCWQWLDDGKEDGRGSLNLQLSFQLPAGCFATALLRECLQTFEEKRAV